MLTTKTILELQTFFESSNQAPSCNICTSLVVRVRNPNQFILISSVWSAASVTMPTCMKDAPRNSLRRVDHAQLANKSGWAIYLSLRPKRITLNQTLKPKTMMKWRNKYCLCVQVSLLLLLQWRHFLYCVHFFRWGGWLWAEGVRADRFSVTFKAFVGPTHKRQVF